MTSSKPKILIVGSGPVGSILALSLLKNGVPVRIIEKDTKHHVGTRGPGVMPRTLELEQFLGVRADVEKYSISGSLVRIYDPKDPYLVVSSKPMLQSVPPTPAYPTGKGVSVPQYLHEMVLREHIERTGGKIDLGVSLVGLQQDKDGVIVELSETRDGKLTSVKEKYEYVIGADGGHSSVRKSIGLSFLGETRDDDKMYILDCKIEGLEEKDIHTWSTPNGGRILCRYTGRPKSFQILFIGADEHLDLLRTKEQSNIQQAVFEATGRTDIFISDITWQGEWRPNIRMAEHFQSSGRVFVAGDAAHTHSPAGGQGLNSGAMDAFNLAWKLALVVKGHAHPKLLDSYELERLPVISEMLKISTGLHGKIRDNFAPPKSKISEEPGPSGEGQQQQPAGLWMRGRKLFQLDVNYRWSPIVLDERFDEAEAAKQPNAYGTEGHEARAGDRAPDAPNLLIVKCTAKESKADVGEEKCLFDLFTPEKHTVLVFSSESDLSKAKAIFDALGSSKLQHELIRTVLILPSTSSDTVEAAANFILKDTQGHAYTGYDIKEAQFQVVIVRPDGVIGAFVEGEEGIAKYFSLVYGES